MNKSQYEVRELSRNLKDYPGVVSVRTQNLGLSQKVIINILVF